MNETLTRPCAGGCGSSLLVFVGFDNLDTCQECTTRDHRLAIDDARKAAEWDEAMLWLDAHGAPTWGVAELSLEARLDRVWDELTR